MFRFDDEWTHTPEALGEVLYGMGYRQARDRLRAGLHPDGVRAEAALVEQFGGDLGPDAWRGIEDALAGRPPTVSRRP